MSLTAADLVADAKTRIREISANELAASTASRVLIDVREPAEFATGHLPGAVNIPRGLLEFEIAAHPAVANVTEPALADKQRALVIYCAAGGRAALATDILQKMGFTNVVSIRGGIRACIDANMALSAHS